MQLELDLWGASTVRGAIVAFFALKTEGLAEGTMDDYRERAWWCLEEFGEQAPLSSLTFDRLHAAVRSNREELANVTIKKRLDFLRWVVALAVERGHAERVPMFPKLRSDARVCSNLHTVSDWERFRAYLPPGPFRRAYDLGFWTGQHLRAEVCSMQRWMLDPEHIEYEEKGCFWRRNRKYRRCVPGWIPAQPELLLIHRELVEGLPARRDALIVGRLWNVQRTLNMAWTRAVAAGEDVPRVTPTDLRRSFASMLSARGWTTPAVRIALGHAGEIQPGSPSLSSRPSTATRHYMFAAPGLFPTTENRQ